MKQHLWKDEALCLGMDNNTFFDKYEDHEGSRRDVDALCKQCPVKKIKTNNFNPENQNIIINDQFSWKNFENSWLKFNEII